MTETDPLPSPSDCGCGPAFQQPKPNGTCATCGGWLPGERPKPLPWLRDDLKKAGEQITRHEAQSKWVCQPWFDEGEGYPEQPGTPHVIEAATREAALAAFPVGEYTALSWVDVMTPAEWFKSGGGYPLEGIDRA